MSWTELPDPLVERSDGSIMNWRCGEEEAVPADSRTIIESTDDAAVLVHFDGEVSGAVQAEDCGSAQMR
ncbi:MAG: hypothetical protein NTY35_06745 [Planctomycetota bacterium]|nr:hypothetical protein [Planctomycetota bacterium]